MNESTQTPTQRASLLAEHRLNELDHGLEERSSGAKADCFHKSLEWTADGTTVLTCSSDNKVWAFVLPQDLLEPRGKPAHLSPEGILGLPEPTAAIAAAPYFSLSHAQTHSVLVGCNDHPIQLHRCIPDPSDERIPSPPQPSSILATYPLIHRTTEAYLAPRSLLWPAPGTHFLAGTQNLISLFDLSRPGADGPAVRLPTIQSTRHLAKGGGVGMRGTVSALSLQSAKPSSGSDSSSIGAGGLVAAGTWTRWIGLYDLASPPASACAATWSIAAAADAAVESGGEDSAIDGPIGGTGIVQTLWSPCGRYLVVNERRSRGMLLYDVRVTGRLLGALVGRDGNTNQRLSCAVYAPASNAGEAAGLAKGDGGGGPGFEVWAGDINGTVHVWEGAGMSEGVVQPFWEWQAHGSAVGGVAMHMSGSVIASCSGSWSTSDRVDGPDVQIPVQDGPDQAQGPSEAKIPAYGSLRIWSIGGF